jgi:phage terminase large subunit
MQVSLIAQDFVRSLSSQAILDIAARRMEHIAARKRQKIFEFRGAALAVQSCTEREVILSGPARSAKTFGVLYKFHRLAEDYAGARLLVIRQTRESLTESALVTFEQEILPPGHFALTGIQRQNRHSYVYANGSEIIVAGFRQSTRDQTARIMSTAYDAIFVNEVNELLEEQYQQLTTRLSHFVTPYQQIVGDMNPPQPLHWIWRREKAGKLRLFQSGLQDNPKWWDESASDWTAEGREVVARLSSLTGVLRDRLYLGKSVMAEGLVYGDVWEDGALGGNVSEEAEYIAGAGPVLWFVDDGYSAGGAPHSAGIDPQTGEYVSDAHPRVILFAQVKPDGHVDVFDESYACLKLSNVHIEEAQARGYPEPDYAVHGPGTAEIRGRLTDAGIAPRGCQAKVEESVKELRAAIASDANGWRRVRVHPRCRHLRAEMLSYAYEPGSEKPVKQYDHGPDALRGGIWTLRFER